MLKIRCGICFVNSANTCTNFNSSHVHHSDAIQIDKTFVLYCCNVCVSITKQKQTSIPVDSYYLRRVRAADLSVVRSANLALIRPFTQIFIIKRSKI